MTNETNEKSKPFDWKSYYSKYMRDRYHADPEFKQKRKDASMKSRAKKPEHYKKIQHEYRQNNKDKIREYNRVWQKNNRAKQNEYMKKYREDKKVEVVVEEGEE